MRTADLAKQIVDLIVEDISDRSALQNVWESVDDDVREEILQTWQRLICDAVGGKKIIVD